MTDDDQESLAPAVQRIWQRVLKVDTIVSDDDFFELGGHSLNAMRIIAMVRREIAHDVTIDLLFDNPEFAAFVRAVTAHVALIK